MANISYIESGSIKPITGIWVGVNNTAKFVKKGWVGVNGVARLVYSREIVAIPVLSGSYTYNGNEQTVLITNLETDKVNVSGILKATNAGTYQITFSLKNSQMAWADYTREDKVLSWTINKQVVLAPELNTARKYVYQNTTYTPEFNNYPPFDSNIMIKSGDTEAINAGNYTLLISFIEPMNYKWQGQDEAHESDPQYYYWTIERSALDIPVLVNDTFNYDGTEKTIQFIITFRDRLIRKTGTLSATAMGNYVAIIELADTNNYKWYKASGYFDIDPKYYFWYIIKAVGYVSVSPDHVNLDDYNEEICIVTGSSNDSSAYKLEYDTSCMRCSIYYNDYEGKLKVSIRKSAPVYSMYRTVKVILKETESYASATAEITVHLI